MARNGGGGENYKENQARKSRLSRGSTVHSGKSKLQEIIST